MGLAVPMKNLPHIQEGKGSGDSKGGQSDALRSREGATTATGLAARRGMGGRWGGVPGHTWRLREKPS